MNFIINGLGNLLAHASDLTLPKPIIRSAVAQEKFDKQTEKLKLYQSYSCPYCIRTRRAIHRLNLNIEKVDINNIEASTELALKGSKLQVPCLRVNNNDETSWIYESAEIIRFLNERFQ